MTLKKPYPAAPRSDTKEYLQSAENGSVEVANPYDWLQDLDSPQTKAFVEAQNAAFDDFLSDTDPTILSAKQKLGAILWSTYSDAFVTSAPKFVGDDVFLRILGRGKPFGVTYRWPKRAILERKAVGGGEALPEPTVFHDEAVSGNALISSSFSQGGKYWAYNEAVSGSDWGVIKIKTVSDCETLSDEIHHSKFNTKPGHAFGWLGDTGFFYQYWLAANETKDGRRRPQLRFHRLGDPQERDEVVHEDEEHPECTFRMSVNEGQSLAVLEIFGQTATSKIKIAAIDSSLKLHFTTVSNDFSAEWE